MKKGFSWETRSVQAVRPQKHCVLYSLICPLFAFLLIAMARQFPAKATRTGKPIFAPAESDLYSKNAAPPTKLLPRNWDFIDADGHKYWDGRASDVLSEWMSVSVIRELISDNYNAETDTVLFVRQSAEQKKDNAVFTLADSGDSLTLFARNTLAVHTCVVLDVGDRASTSYKARTVRWMLVRGLAAFAAI
jgi:hypothetical protein